MMQLYCPWLAHMCPLTISIVLAFGCSRQPEVVVYAALDAEFSQPIFDQFQHETGIRVLAKFDVESTKTVGLVNALMNESARPRADVFWNNEILHTLRLQRQGLLEPFKGNDQRLAIEALTPFRAHDYSWRGFAARARVLLVNTQLVPDNECPRSIEDLADARWRGRVGIAKPLFGTTATHAACLFAAWGDKRAKGFFQRLKRNSVQIMAGNKPVAQAVSAGRLAFGLTDTDDAIGELEAGHPVAIVYPDQNDDGLGTLFIPNTLAVIRGAPHPNAARQLIEFLLRPEIEEQLSAGPSAQIPLHPAAKASLRVETPRTVKPMKVDFPAAADKWEQVATFLRDEFTRD